MKLSIFSSFVLLAAVSSAFSDHYNGGPICGSLYGFLRTFDSELDFYNENSNTFNVWTLVNRGPCPPVSECKLYNPVCGVSNKNTYRTFVNLCSLITEQSAGLVWSIVSPGICPSYPPAAIPSAPIASVSSAAYSYQSPQAPSLASVSNLVQFQSIPPPSTDAAAAQPVSSPIVNKTEEPDWTSLIQPRSLEGQSAPWSTTKNIKSFSLPVAAAPQAAPALPETYSQSYSTSVPYAPCSAAASVPAKTYPQASTPTNKVAATITNSTQSSSATSQPGSVYAYPPKYAPAPDSATSEQAASALSSLQPYAQLSPADLATILLAAPNSVLNSINQPAAPVSSQPTPTYSAPSPAPYSQQYQAAPTQPAQDDAAISTSGISFEQLAQVLSAFLAKSQQEVPQTSAPADATPTLELPAEPVNKYTRYSAPAAPPPSFEQSTESPVNPSYSYSPASPPYSAPAAPAPAAFKTSYVQYSETPANSITYYTPAQYSAPSAPANATEAPTKPVYSYAPPSQSYAAPADPATPAPELPVAPDTPADPTTSCAQKSIESPVPPTYSYGQASQSYSVPAAKAAPAPELPAQPVYSYAKALQSYYAPIAPVAPASEIPAKSVYSYAPPTTTTEAPVKPAYSYAPASQSYAAPSAPSAILTPELPVKPVYKYAQESQSYAAPSAPAILTPELPVKPVYNYAQESSAPAAPATTYEQSTESPAASSTPATVAPTPSETPADTVYGYAQDYQTTTTTVAPPVESTYPQTSETIPSETPESQTTSSNSETVQTIYNGAVYQGPYHFEPSYKHINFGNFNFLPPNVAAAAIAVPQPNYGGYAPNPASIIPDSLTKPAALELALQYLQNIASQTEA